MRLDPYDRAVPAPTDSWRRRVLMAGLLFVVALGGPAATAYAQTAPPPEGAAATPEPTRTPDRLFPVPVASPSPSPEEEAEEPTAAPSRPGPTRVRRTAVPGPPSPPATTAPSPVASPAATAVSAAPVSRAPLPLGLISPEPSAPAPEPVAATAPSSSGEQMDRLLTGAVALAAVLGLGGGAGLYLTREERP